MFLSIEDYDSQERTARSRLSAREISAFGPVTFQDYGYPVVVREEIELLRYVDAMHEYSAPNLLADGVVLSIDEAELIRDVSEVVLTLTATHFQRPIRPWLATLSAIETLRLVNGWAGKVGKKSLTVFEFGPGSAYLGAFLCRAGHRLIAMDNSQGFYLWQNRLYGALAGDSVLDFAVPDAGPLRDDPTKVITHVPWWQFLTLTGTMPFAVDVVLSEHCLVEMSQDARRFALRISNQMLKRDGASAHLFEHLGGTSRHGSRAALFHEFDAAGFDAIAKRLFYAFVPKSGPLSDLAIAPDDMAATGIFRRLAVKRRRNALRARFPLVSLDNGLPRFAPSGRTETVAAREVIPFLASEAPLDYAFLAHAGVTVPGNLK
ncbi:hypothetical protein H261_07923 [Paramagnetospirillum caucaseum]|uniref:Uncharacterized protein n=1 Tax=Paramagnetospirillum caucaseum TaxID=1244869 RepID=M2YC08_9PROT|nr:hypothetical protein [Paramagnetospirillum caucaseum]EME70541.1 hypothetical protein H261_07923 [Paramagnetospirillum caucaseum]